MKKVTDYLKSYALIICGALLFLYYMNWLSYEGAGLAIGIIAVVCSACFLAVGILNIIAGDKFSANNKKLFDAATVGLFAAFIFAYTLILTINLAQVEGYMGPTAWIIAILTMVASLCLCVMYIVSKFADIAGLDRFAYLFAAIFALALLLNIMFNNSGAATTLGAIDVILAVIYVTFTIYLFDTLSKPQAAPAAEEAPMIEESDDAQEEAPAEKNDGEQF